MDIASDGASGGRAGRAHAQLRRCGAVEQQFAKPLTVLVGPDQFAGIIFAARALVGWTAWLAPRSASGAILQVPQLESGPSIVYFI
jgi:hypothetical protein